MSVFRQPGGGISINLCTTDSVSVVVNSAQAANLVNPYVTFFPPAGVSVLSPVLVEYPRGSGNYQSATTTSLPGGGVQINLAAHTGIGTNGILGTANANPAYVPLGGDREVKVSVYFTTSCDYTSGTSLKFNAFGSRPCGVPAIDNGIAATTSALNITGASAPGGAGVVISFGGGATSVGCGSSAVTLSLVTTPTTIGTVVGDTITYVLPIGMGYAGNLTPGYSAVVTGGGGAPTIVKIAMPIGVPASTPVNFNFDVTPQGGGCGSVNITGAYQRRIASLSCSGVPCASSSVVIASATSPNITLVKPSLALSSVVVLDTPAWRQANYPANHVKVYYSNNGTQAYPSNRDTVEFFCNSTATVPFAKMPLTKNVAIGASDSDEYYVMMPIGSCSPGDVITTRIQTQTAGGTEQCLCAPSSFEMAGVGLPLSFLGVQSGVEDCAVSLSWQYNKQVSVERFELERSHNGAQYQRVAILSGTASDYVDVTPSSGTWYYRIRSVTANGEQSYSGTQVVQTSKCMGSQVKVYPNPAQDQLRIVLQGTSAEQRYELYDMIGRIVGEGVLNANSNNVIDVSGLSKGAYMLRVVMDSQSSIHQVHIAK